MKSLIFLARTLTTASLLSALVATAPIMGSPTRRKRMRLPKEGKASYCAPTSCYICNDCFAKMNDEICGIADTIVKSQSIVLRNYLELFNDNFNLSIAIMNSDLVQARNLLFKSPPSTLFAAIYNMPIDFGSKSNKICTDEWFCPSHSTCKSTVDPFNLLFEEMATALYRWQQQEVCIHTKGRRHTNYYRKYRDFIKSSHTLQELNDYIKSLRTLLRQVKPTNAFLIRSFFDLIVSTVVSSFNALESGAYFTSGALRNDLSEPNASLCYRQSEPGNNSLLKSPGSSSLLKSPGGSLVARLNIIQDHSLSETVMPLDAPAFQAIDLHFRYGTHLAYGLDIMSLCTLYHLIDYDVRIEGNRCIFNDRISRLIFEKRVLEGKNIYDVFRLYKVAHKLPTPVFMRLFKSVHSTIVEMENKLETLRLRNFHQHLIVTVLSSYDTGRVTATTFVCFADIEREFPSLAPPIDEIEKRYVNSLAETACQSFVQIAYDLARQHHFSILEKILRMVSLKDQGVLALLRAISSRDGETSIKICVLYELVECGVINKDNHRYIMASIENNNTLAVTYALALVSFIFKNFHTGNKLTYELCEMHLQTYSRYMRIYTYDIAYEATYAAYKDNGASGYKGYFSHNIKEYYLLHAYNYALFQTYDSMDSSRTPKILPVYPPVFFHRLWRHLEVDVEISPENPCYSELRCVQVLVFRKLKLYSTGPDASKTPDAMKSIMMDITNSRTSIIDAYTLFLESDPACVGDLLTEYALAYGAIKNRVCQIKGLQPKLFLRRRDFEKLAKLVWNSYVNYSPGAFKKTVAVVFKKLFIFQSIEHTLSETGELTTDLVLKVANLWLIKACTDADSFQLPRETQLVISFAVLLNYNEPTKVFSD